MNDILSIILNYFKHYIIDFDVYVIADTQERTKYLYPSEYPHADESEFFLEKNLQKLLLQYSMFLAMFVSFILRWNS